MGSKSSIAKWIVAMLPKATRFYDLFGGGFSITHAMLVHRSKHFKHFHFNEPREGICELVKDSIDGKYSYENFKPPFVDREMFFREIEKPYIKMCWSFGNTGKSYLFSEEIEPYKRSMHNAIVFNQFDELAEKTLGMKAFRLEYSINQRRLFLRARIERYRVTKIPEFLHRYLAPGELEKLQSVDKVSGSYQLQQLQQLRQLQQLEQLERLQQLEQLQQLQQLGNLHFSQGSYDEIEIKPNSVVYCDPPYAGTAKYDNEIDHLKLFDWAVNQPNPVFISEYNIKHQGLFLVAQKLKLQKLAGSGNNKHKMEKVYANQAGVSVLRK